MFNQARNPRQKNDLRLLGRRAVRADRAAKIIFALLAVAHHVYAQLPPDATIVHIDEECDQFFPTLNENRQVVYQCAGESFLTSLIYLYQDDQSMQIADPSFKNVGPSINNDGVVVWAQGVFDDEFWIVQYEDEESAILIDAPFPEIQASINNGGVVSVWSKPCWPEPNDCAENQRYDNLSLTTTQLTFAGTAFRSQPASMNSAAEFAWREIDVRFGLFNSTDRQVMYRDDAVTPLTDWGDHLTSSWINDAGDILWARQFPAPSGSMQIIGGENLDVQLTIPFGLPFGLNSARNVLFASPTITSSWLYRNGLYWQPFDGLLFALADDVNERGDVVGRTLPSAPQDPGDVFLMLSEPVPGDYDQDGDIDLTDAAGLHDCMVPPPDMAGQIHCQQLDFDENGSVDLRDVANFMNVFFGDCGLGIATPPNGNDVCEGGSFSISVDVRGNVASYQWLFGLDQVEIDGATQATLTIENASESQHEGEYGVHVTSECGWEATSKRRHLIEVHSHAPVFDDPPESQAVCEGSTVRFCPSLSGSQDDPYDFVQWQWQKNGVDMPDAANWNCLWLRDVDESDAGSYRVVATNACGSTVSAAATLSIVEPSGPPTIIGHPTTGAYPWVGQSITPYLHVVAECAESYQWYKNGEPISGATDMRIEFPNVKCSDTGAYHVDVINSHGTTVSQNGAMNVRGCE